MHAEVEATHGILANLQTVQQQQVEVDEKSSQLLGEVHGQLGGTLQVESPGGVEVSNPAAVAGGVETAVEENSETVNSTAWAIFGMVVGFGLLAFIFKLVRP